MDDNSNESGNPSGKQPENEAGRLPDQAPPAIRAEQFAVARGPKFALHNAFCGERGLQAGWRLLIFIALLAVISKVLVGISSAFSHNHPRGQAFAAFTAGSILIGELTSFAVVLLASWIMSRIEGRTIGDYGLPARRAFGRTFWQGVLIGFVAISVLLAALWLGGAFLFVGFFEEFSFRGYALFTLTDGLGFWPAALALSLLFGYAHHANSGE